MAEQDKPKSRAKKIQASGVEAELTSNNSAATPTAGVGFPSQNQVAGSSPVLEFKTLEALHEEMARVLRKQSLLTMFANTLLILGILTGISAFILPLNSCTETLTGYDTVSVAVSNFFSTLFLCIALGIAFGTGAAICRGFSRAAARRLQILHIQEIWMRQGTRPN